MAASTCTEPARPRVGVGAIVWRGDAVLLVRRGKAPALGEWSVPGGAQEFGETLFEAAAREVAEETGVTMRPLRVLTAVDGLVRDDGGHVAFHYTIVEVEGAWVAGEPVAADDAADARWARRAEWEALIASTALRAVLALADDQRRTAP